MAAILIAHHDEAALGRQRAAAMVAKLRGIGLQVHTTAQLAGRGSSLLANFEALADAAAVIVLLWPRRWWAEGGLAWRDSLVERVEFLVRNGAGAGLCVVEAEGVELPAPLADLPRLGQGAELELGRSTGHLELPLSEAGPRLALAEDDLALAILDEAVAEARAGRRAVLVVGGPGTGKSALLRSWLERRRAAGERVLTHFGVASVGLSRYPDLILANLEAQLAEGDSSEAASLVVDGLEPTTRDQVRETVGRLVELLDGRRELTLVAGLRWGATSAAAFRALGSEAGAGPGLPVIDLEAEPFVAWREARVRELLASSFEGRALAHAVDEAAGSLGFARARAACPEPRDELPPAVERELERSWAGLSTLDAPIRARVHYGLAVLAQLSEPPPQAVFEALLAHGGESSLLELRVHAREWLRLRGQPGAERVELAHPALARFLARELEPRWSELANRMARALLRERGREDSRDYVLAELAPARLRALGVSNQATAFFDVGELEGRMRADPAAVERELGEVAQALAEPARRALLSCLRQLPRRLGLEPGELAMLLWSGLRARGWSEAELREQFSWPGGAPALRLRHRPSRVDGCDRVLARHERGVLALAIDPEGERALTIGCRGRLQVWHVASGAELEARQLVDSASEAAFDLEASLVVIGRSDRSVVAFDLETGETLVDYEGHEAYISELAISGMGPRVLSCDGDGRLWTWAPGERPAQLELGREIETCALAPDGRRALLLSRGQGELLLYDFDDEELRPLDPHPYTAYNLGVSRDGSRGLSVCVGEARLWDLASGELLERFTRHGGQTDGGAIFMVGDREVLTASGARVRRWSLSSGEIRFEHIAGPRSLERLAASIDGERYLSGDGDVYVRLWRFDPEAEQPAEGVVYPTRVLTPALDGRRVWSCGGRSALELLDPVTGELDLRVEDIAEVAGIELGLAVVDEDRLALVGSGRKLVLVDAHTGESLAAEAISEDWLRCCAVDPKGRWIACGGDDRSIRLIDLDALDAGRIEVRATLEGHGGPVRDLAFASDGRLLAVDGDGQIHVWDPAAGERRARYESKANVSCSVLQLDGDERRLFVGGSSSRVELWDLATGERVREFELGHGSVDGLALADEGRVLLAVAGDDRLWGWAVEGGARVLSFELEFRPTALAVVADRVVVGDRVGNRWVFDADWARLRVAAGGEL